MNDEFASGQAARWDSKRAASWQKWFPVIERGAQVLSDRMVALAELGPGDRVLDIATGLGEPAVTAARAVAPDGHVDGVDLSADMLAFARQRVDDLGLGIISFRVADAVEMDAPAPPYDAVLCRWGLMFMADLGAALDSIHHSLRSGGRFVAAVWGPADSAPALSLSARVVLSHLELPPPAEGPGTPFGLGDVDALAASVESAGFDDVAAEPIDITFTFDSCEEFARLRRDRSAPLLARIAHFPSKRQDDAWDAVAQAVRPYADSGGTVRIENRAYCVSARRP